MKPDFVKAAEEGRDMRMVRCVLDGHHDCPAIIAVACICNQMTREVYEAAYHRKYGLDD